MTLDTLVAPASYELEVKHSRFLARAIPAADPATALEWLEEARIPDATHNCWAWRIGNDYRSSDDGEPAGTAGRPILAAIDGQGFDQVAVLVIRWFGGIKLGAGGLVRAYGGCAAECLRRATRSPLVEYADVRLQAPFEDIGAVHAALDAFGAEKTGEEFDASGAVFVLRLPAARVEALRTHLRDASRDRIRFRDA